MFSIIDHLIKTLEEHQNYANHLKSNFEQEVVRIKERTFNLLNGLGAGKI